MYHMIPFHTVSTLDGFFLPKSRGAWMLRLSNCAPHFTLWSSAVEESNNIIVWLLQSLQLCVVGNIGVHPKGQFFVSCFRSMSIATKKLMGIQPWLRSFKIAVQTLEIFALWSLQIIMQFCYKTHILFQGILFHIPDPTLS